MNRDIPYMTGMLSSMLVNHLKTQTLQRVSVVSIMIKIRHQNLEDLGINSVKVGNGKGLELYMETNTPYSQRLGHLRMLCRVQLVTVTSSHV